MAKKSNVNKATESQVVDSQSETPFLTPGLQDVRLIIYKMLSYDDLSKCRQLCADINREVSVVLTAGFKDFSKQLNIERSQLKKELPKRESDRRKHALFAYSEIISSLETRRDLLEMTYRKYIDRDAICFIPGKVLDEGFRLLKYLRAQKSTNTSLPYELLKDFRDLSSMAIDHFDEYISPTLRQKASSWDFESFWVSSTQKQQKLMTPSLGNRLPMPTLPLLPQNPSNIDLQQKISEQDAVIRKQNEHIQILKGTIGLFAKAVDNLSEFVGLPFPMQAINDMLLAVGSDDHKSPPTKNDEPCCSKFLPQETPRYRKRKLEMELGSMLKRSCAREQ